MARGKKPPPPEKRSAPPNTNKRSVGEADVELGRRIRLRRVEIGISQSDLGEALGLSFQQVQKYEKGINRVGAARLEQVAEVLKVPMTFFFGPRSTDGQVAHVVEKQQREVESLLFLNSAFSLRLLRAYSAINNKAVQRQFVTLMERVAGIINNDT